MIQNRNIVVCILLSILTCGIYSLVWMYQMTNDVAYLNNDVKFNGASVILFSILTCGIYTIYWNYKMGKEIYEAKVSRGLRVSDNSVLYLILCIIGFSIINYCLMQSDLNEVHE